MLTIRNATRADIDAITAIYNEAITKTVATFDTMEKTRDEMQHWFDQHNSNYPLLVAEQGDIVAGWIALSKYSTKCAYADTAEISLYVLQDHQGKGIGKQLMKAIMKEGEKNGLHTVLARIAEGNQASIHLHESVGFAQVGMMKEVGLKFGKRLDVYLMQKLYNEK